MLKIASIFFLTRAVLVARLLVLRTETKARTIRHQIRLCLFIVLFNTSLCFPNTLHPSLETPRVNLRLIIIRHSTLAHFRRLALCSSSLLLLQQMMTKRLLARSEKLWSNKRKDLIRSQMWDDSREESMHTTCVDLRNVCQVHSRPAINISHTSSWKLT